MIKLPFLDIKAINARQFDEFHKVLSRVLDSGWLILGEETTSFEAEFSQYCGVDHCVGVGNGLEALNLEMQKPVRKEICRYS